MLRALIALFYLNVVIAVCIYVIYKMPADRNVPMKTRIWRWVVIVALVLVIALSITALIRSIVFIWVALF